MEVALNSVVSPSSASSAQSTQITSTLVGGTEALLGEQNIKNNSESGGAGTNVIGVNNSLLNLFGSSPAGFKNDSAFSSSDDYALLASLTLKNALNVNSDTNGSSIYQLMQQSKHQSCNNNILISKQQQKTKIFTLTSSGLLPATATKKQSTTNTCNNTKTSSSKTISSLICSATKASSSPAMSVASITTATKSTCSTATTPGNNNIGVCSGKNSSQIPSDILDDLASRFIINVPDMELSNLIRICFQIELAHWFYLDFFCASSIDQQHQQDEDGKKKKKLPSCGIKQFAIQIFQHIPFLREHLSTIDKILDDWKNYKLSVPTYGAILISEDLNYCLLVQSYFAKSSWGFPKGKVNENEDPVHCATREVYEETGYDITELIVPNDYIEAVINYQYTRLYIVRDVSLQTQFSPRTRNEIKCCDWFPIDSLPVNKNDAISKAKLGINANSFFMIMPFVKRLKKWVHDMRESGTGSRRKYSGGGGSNSPISNSPTSLMTTAAAATAAAVAGNSNNCNNNQKHLNANCSNKKNKQHTNIDDKQNALNNGIVTIVANNNSSSNSNAGTTTSNNSNRSKRQRHKSMGDLDGIKLNNLSSNTNNQSSNCKKAVISTTAANNTTTTTTVNTVSDINIGKGNSTHKRNLNSTKCTANSSNGGNHNNNNSNSMAGCTSSKRQLFHSQSQSGCNQHGEKIVSSFDLIRKEKQQLKAAAQAEKTAAKANKQQQQQSSGGGNGRVRAKSQGDKMSMQQQNSHKNNNSYNVNNKQRVQKQQSVIVSNSNATENSNFNNNVVCKTTTVKSRSPPPICGTDLLTLAAESVVSFNELPKNTASAPNSVQKPRPASVSLHFATPPAPAKDTAMQQLQRMASGTNLRILKRSTSYQPQQHPIQRLQRSQNEQDQQQAQETEQKRQQQPLKFTPSFNSWTNFSFTKNFIANVFC